MIEKKNMNLRKRLMYQCTHMGTKELDLLLGEFAKKKLKNLSIKQLKELDLILKYNDHNNSTVEPRTTKAFRVK